MKPLAVIACLALLPAAVAVHAAPAQLIVQSSPLAGFQFYSGPECWSDMAVGDALELEREPENAHDANAVRVFWRGRMLGYVPRTANAHVARQLDRGAPVKARIVKLAEHRSPWRRLEIEVYVDL